MASFTWPSQGGSSGGGGVTIYANFAAFPASAPSGTLAIDVSTGILYEYFAGSWQVLARLGAVAAPYAGTAPIGSGVTSVAVVFTTALASTPAVVCWLSSSNAAANIIGSQGSGISAAGFTAQLGATTPDTTYTLNWIASVAND